MEKSAYRLICEKLKQFQHAHWSAPSPLTLYKLVLAVGDLLIKHNVPIEVNVK